MYKYYGYHCKIDVYVADLGSQIQNRKCNNQHYFITYLTLTSRGAKFIYHKNKRVGFDFIIIQLSKEIK